MPGLLQQRADQIGRDTGATSNNWVVNIYRTGADYIAPHHDQAFSDSGGKFESQLPVVIDLRGAELAKINMEPGDSYVLTGALNMHAKHGVSACESFKDGPSEAR